MTSFGKLQLRDAENLEFLDETFANDNKSDFPLIFDHYRVVDVVGDGNCGPYSFLLALMNKASTTQQYKELLHGATGKKYQEKCTELRKTLREFCTEVIVSANREREVLSCLAVEDDFDAIYSPEADYFPGDSSAIEDDMHFPMNLAPFLLSAVEKIRVVIITAVTESLETKYTTTVWDSRLGFNQNGWWKGTFLYYDGFYKVPDSEYYAMDTVEILFALQPFSTEDGETEISKHFLFLKRKKKMSKKEESKFVGMKPNRKLGGEPEPSPQPTLDFPPASQEEQETGNRKGSKKHEEEKDDVGDEEQDEDESEDEDESLRKRKIAEDVNTPNKKRKKNKNTSKTDEPTSESPPASQEEQEKGNRKGSKEDEEEKDDDEEQDEDESEDEDESLRKRKNAEGVNGPNKKRKKDKNTSKADEPTSDSPPSPQSTPGFPQEEQEKGNGKGSKEDEEEKGDEEDSEDEEEGDEEGGEGDEEEKNDEGHRKRNAEDAPNEEKGEGDEEESTDEEGQRKRKNAEGVDGPNKRRRKNKNTNKRTSPGAALAESVRKERAKGNGRESKMIALEALQNTLAEYGGKSSGLEGPFLRINLCHSN